MHLPRRTNRAATPLRARGTRLILLSLASGAAALALTGCGGFEYREAVCGGGEYPVMSVGGTGSACVQDDEEPPAGYVRYPKGKVPQQVDDKWDVYWDTHTLDREGHIVDAPAGG
ncbi:SCO0607 family lipoprotein [Streptomyces sp. NPDC048590]|uniref:SCO0607 family lipoprotein n=1 Tax=Streptomyces sp. NPDC048590 TaxID=3365574 RepID=UPI00371FC8BB